jgi:hypothetical protein
MLGMLVLVACGCGNMQKVPVVPQEFNVITTFFISFFVTA